MDVGLTLFLHEDSMEERLTNYEHGDEWTLVWLCMSLHGDRVLFFFLTRFVSWVCLVCPSLYLCMILFKPHVIVTFNFK